MKLMKEFHMEEGPSEGTDQAPPSPAHTHQIILSLFNNFTLHNSISAHKFILQY